MKFFTKSSKRLKLQLLAAFLIIMTLAPVVFAAVEYVCPNRCTSVSCEYRDWATHRVCGFYPVDYVICFSCQSWFQSADGHHNFCHMDTIQQGETIYFCIPRFGTPYIPGQFRAQECKQSQPGVIQYDVCDEIDSYYGWKNTCDYDYDTGETCHLDPPWG